MNQRTTRLLLEMLLIVILSTILSMVQTDLLIKDYYILIVCLLFPLLWITFRYGASTGVVTATLSGFVIGILKVKRLDIIAIVIQSILPLLSVGFAGLFAKYTQKTLNNKRYSSTYLNLTTGTFFTVLLYFLAQYLINQFVYSQTVFEYKGWSLVINVILNTVLWSALLCIIAKSQPKWIIPKRSRFLSRKETTSLLND